MALDIVQRTISGETDKRLQASKAYYVRKLKETEWTKLRVIMRISFLTTKAVDKYTDYPAWYFGLCTGTDDPPGTATPLHFAGLASNSTLRVNAEDVNFSRGINYASINPFPTVIKGGTETRSSYINYGGSIARSESLLPSMYGITFTRNSPTSFSCHGYKSSTCTLAEFKSAIDSTTDVPGNAQSNATFSLAPDETTYGVFDSLCFAFSGDSDSFEISDLQSVRLA